MELRGRILLGLVVAVLTVPASASAQSASCVVYPQLCPPTTPVTTTTTPAPVTSQSGAGPTAIDDDAPGGGDPAPTDDDGRPLPDEAKGAGPADAGAGPVVVGGRALRGCGGYAVLHFGDLDEDLQERIEQAAGEPMWVASLREPVPTAGLAKLLAATRFATVDDKLSLLGPLGRRIGRETVTPASILPKVRDTLFETFEGELGLPRAIVIARDPDELDGEAAQSRNRFFRSILAGMLAEQIPTESGGLMPIPVVGAEQSTDKRSDISYWIKRKVRATVDNLDQRSGRNTLVKLMDGQTGHYGVKDTATSLTPAAYTGPRPIRCRTAPSVTVDPTSARSPMTSGAVAMIALLLLLGAWAVSHSGRRTLRRRMQSR